MLYNSITVNQKNGVIIVGLKNEKIIDESIIGEITGAVFDIIEKGQPIKLLISFARVEYLSSIMLGVLIRLSKRVFEGGGTMKLCSISPNLYEMFVITRLHKLFDIYTDEATAVSSFEA